MAGARVSRMAVAWAGANRCTKPSSFSGALYDETGKEVEGSGRVMCMEIPKLLSHRSPGAVGTRGSAWAFWELLSDFYYDGKTCRIIEKKTFLEL